MSGCGYSRRSPFSNCPELAVLERRIQHGQKIDIVFADKEEISGGLRCKGFTILYPVFEGFYDDMRQSSLCIEGSV